MKLQAIALCTTLSLASACGAATPPSGAVRPADIDRVLASARCGQTIILAGGDYGDGKITGGGCTAPITLVPASPDKPASFRTLSIGGAGVVIKGVQVAYAPDARSASFSCAVSIDGARDVTLSGMKIIGGPAVTGVEQTAERGDNTGNVVGLPTGRGVCIQNSQGVSLTDSEMSRMKLDISSSMRMNGFRKPGTPSGMKLLR